MNRLEAIQHIIAQADQGELIFPTNMRAAINLQRALNDPDCHLESAAQLALGEPLIAARLVAIANSVAYTRYGAKVDNLRNAINLLGFKTLRSLVAAIIVRQFSGGIADPAIREKAELLWQHSAHVAALAKVIAAHLPQLDPDTALFAGIVHEIGGFYLLSRAEALPALLEDSPEGRPDDAERKLALRVLDILMVPQTVASAVESLWRGLHAIPPATLGDTLALANDLAAVPSPLPRSATAGIVQAAEPVDFEIRGKMLQAILAESAGEIRSLTDMLLV